MPENKSADKSANRRVSETRAAHIAEAKRKHRVRLYVTLGLFLTFYLTVSLALGLWVYISFNSVPSGESYGVSTMKKGSNNRETVLTTAKAEDANIGGGLYIPANDLDRLCGLAFAGDKEKLTVLIPNGIQGEYMECFAGSSLVIINGTRLRLSVPVIYIGGAYYLPVELAEEYMTGLKVDYDETEKVCRISLADDSSALGFRFKPVISPVSIPAPALE